ncbi:MAG: class II aldolase/adducin family protein [Pseudomonadota bacterium]|nr:class II aldolase/adducin family protein [Pseudomonadota bacterium]
MQEEGVIKFELQFSKTAATPLENLCDLNAWRRILCQLELLGQDPARYAGYGFGNVSHRITPFDAPAGQRRFVISGTQTGALANLDGSHYALINAYDPERNRVVAEGPVKPSSESLTHAMIYDLDASVHVILHVHSPHIWRHAHAMGIPVTDETVPYGTPEMARETARLFRETDVKHKGIFSMAGHEDGVISFGKTADDAGSNVLRALAHAYAIKQ